MKPIFLERHLNGCYPNHKSKGTAFFKQKEDELKQARLDCSGYISKQNEAGLRASYMVSLRIAQVKKPHNIAEKLIISYCEDIIRCVGGCDAEKVALIPHSNDTVHRHIVDSFFVFFYLYIYPPDSQESDGGVIHRVSNYPDLLPEMPRYCCTLVI